MNEDDAMRLGRNIQDINERLQQFERAFQDHANYLQKLEARIAKLQPRPEEKSCFWMGEANTRLGER